MVMFRHLIADNPPLRYHLEDNGIRQDELKFIESLMDPEHVQPTENVMSKYLCEIHVNNTHSFIIPLYRVTKDSSEM